MTKPAGCDAKPWYLYVIRTVGGGLYAGITTDISRRFTEHCERGAKAAKFFSSSPPLELAFQREIGARSLALKVERAFKKLTKRQKESIVANGELRFDSQTGKIGAPPRLKLFR